MSGIVKTLQNTVENTTKIAEIASRTGMEVAKVTENVGKLANTGLEVTDENVKAVSSLSVAGMTVTKDNLIAVSSLSVAGIDTAKLTLEESRKYITAA